MYLLEKPNFETMTTLSADWAVEQGEFSFCYCVCVCVCVCLCQQLSHGQLCNPMNCSPSGSSVHGIIQAKNTRVGYHFFLQRFTTEGNVHWCSHFVRQVGIKNNNTYADSVIKQFLAQIYPTNLKFMFKHKPEWKDGKGVCQGCILSNGSSVECMNK